MTLVETIKQFVGTKEIGNNHGFDNPYFEVLLTRLGWTRGAAWCGYSAILKWYLHYQGQDTLYARIKHVLHPHVMTMWERASTSQVVTVGQIPIVGAIACWSTGGGAGHCGVVVTVNADGTFINVEGNTSPSVKGNQREGDGEYEKPRTTVSRTNWKFLGFIYLPQ